MRYRPGRMRLNHTQLVLLTWVLALWVGRPRQLVLALDATQRRDQVVVLVVSVLYRHQAIPIAWPVLRGQPPEAWLPHCRHLLTCLAPVVSRATTVQVLCDAGLNSHKLWTHIVALGWHPVMRYQTHITLQTGPDTPRVPAVSLLEGVGTYGVWEGVAFRDNPRPCTLVALHGRGHHEPWVLLTSLPKAQTDPSRYAWRHWIEQNFRGWKSGGLRWQRTRRLDPQRTARHLLVIAVTSLLAAAYATRHEDACVLGRSPRYLRHPPPDPVPRPPPRVLSILKQGLILLRACLARGRLWARVWLRPLPGPDKTVGLRCLTPQGA